MSTSANMEASSLSSLTQLASNPPKYPRNPTETKRDPLVLYIVRVPGSRDVVLTPLKPSRKNVTAEDVASSLYFLHYQSPEDENLLQAVAEQDIKNTVQPILEEPVPTVTRKPLAQNLGSEAVSGPPRLQPGALGRADRKPLPAPPNLSSYDSTYQETTPQEEVEVRPPLPERPAVQRRPLGPRGPNSSNGLHRKALPAQGPREDPPILSNDIPPLPPRPDQASLENQSPTRQAQYDFTNGNDWTQPEPKGFSVTLIRRDPTSGAQWNIGEVSRQPEECYPPAYGKRSPSPHSKASISIRLTTPGYSQFRGNQAPSNYQHISQPSSFSNAPTDCFSREVTMASEFSKSRDGPRTHTRTASDLTSQRSPTHPGSTDIRASFDTTRSLARIALPSSPPKFLPKPKASRLKGYVFTSPWNGHCSFTTGTSGRSLKCRHTLPSFSSNTDITTTNTTNTNSASSPAILTSELRFNLPTAEIFGASPGTFDIYTKKLKEARQKYGGGGEGRSAGESEDDDNDNDEGPGGRTERLDLSLGQEKAGGGNRGKRAKLGKLIVHDEGMKMLDLVVAANMGVWWETWER